MSELDTKFSIKATVDETEKGSPQQEVETALAVKPFCWADVPDFERPAGPREDFIKSPNLVPLTESQLRERWAGLNMDYEIDDLFRWSSMHRQKMVLSAMMESGEPVLDISDPKFQKRLNERDFLILDHFFQRETQMLEDNLEPDKKGVYNETTGEVKQRQTYRPMKAVDRLASARTIGILQNEKRLLTGQATQIVKVESVDLSAENQRRAAEELKAFRIEVNSAGPTQVNVYELPQPEHVDTLPASRQFEGSELP